MDDIIDIVGSIYAKTVTFKSAEHVYYYLID